MFVARELNLLLMAVTFYTRVSIFQPKNYQAELLSVANRYLPLVGVFVGLFVGCVGMASLQIFPVTISAWFVVFAGLVITGAFHEDGLSDTFDALGAWSIESKLRVMKDSRIGTYGAAVMVFSIGLRALFWMSIPLSYWLITAILVHVLSRIIPLFIIWFLDYVREDETSKAKPIAKRLHGKDLIIACMLTVAVLVISSVSIGLVIIAAVVVALMIATVLIIFWFRKLFGGYTGDLLGASQQLGEWAVLAVLVGFLA